MGDQPLRGEWEGAGKGPVRLRPSTSLGAASPRLHGNRTALAAAAAAAAAAPRGSARPTWSPEGSADRWAGRERTLHLPTLRGQQRVLMGVLGSGVSNAFM